MNFTPILHSFIYPKNPTIQRKIIPHEFEDAVKIALVYYLDLDKIIIAFRVKNQASPLTARPSFFAVFRRAHKRKYIITISDKTSLSFSAIMLRNLSFNAQVGVIGHELAHISDFNKRNGFYFVKLLFMHLSKKKMDEFEYNTDLRCIQHSLGYQLLSWSSEVRLKLNLVQWTGIKSMDKNEKERYMNPESIIEEMRRNKIYNQ